MLNRLNIKSRVMLGFILILILGSVGLFPVITTGMNDLISQAEERELRSLAGQFSQRLADEERLAVALATMISKVPVLNQYLITEDRAQLNAQLQSGFIAMKEQYGLAQFQYHTPPAISWLRVHKPEKFGDDLSSFRNTVVEVNATKKPVSGLEGGVAGLGVRGVVPLEVDGKSWGSVEMGFALNEHFFQIFKEATGTDVGMYLLQPDGRFAKYQSTFSETSLLPDEMAKTIMSGEPAHLSFDFEGKPVTLYGMAVNDYSGKPIGVVHLLMDRTNYVNQLRESQWMVAGVSGVILLIAVIIALLITRSIIRPLNAMHVAMVAVASGKGDLTQRLPVEGKNELTEIAAAFNRFIEHIENVVRSLLVSTAHVSSSGSELFTATLEARRVADQQRRETTDVAAAMHQMSATAQDIARSAESTASYTQEADDLAKQGRTIVDKTISAVSELSDDVHQTSEVVGRVSQQSRDIYTILEVISEISEQTNLLALNAAIEAARAGEQGRGFAVVADEVRALAGRTRQSTEEIHRMINDLQSGTDQTVQVIERSWQRSQATVTEADEAGQALERITQGMDGIRDMSAQIASASEEQTSVSEMINQRVDSISQGALETLESATHIMDETSHISEEISKLMKLVGEFTITRDLRVELALARAAHVAWQMRVRRYLDGKITLTEDQASSHRECDFGRWFYGNGREAVDNASVLQALEAPHQAFHQLVMEIIRLHQQGQTAAAEKAYLDLGRISEEILEGLSRAEQTLRH